MTLFRNIALAGAALAALFTAAAPASSKELKYASWTPAVSYANRVVFKTVFEQIDKETNGAIKWKLFPGGQLVGPKESFTAPGDGLVDAAFGIAIYVPNLVPSLNTIYSTLIFTDDSIQATPAALETFHLNCPSCLTEFQKAKMVAISGWTSSQYHLACREPISNVDQLKGKRIRGTGGPAQLWQLAGATPISSTLPESLTLLQRGGMDCMHSNYSWLQTFGYGDFAKYVTDYPMSLSGPAIGMMMNRATWKGLTHDQQMLHLKKAAWASAAEAAEDFTIEQVKYLKKVETEKGVKVVKADPAGFDDLVSRFDKVQRESVIAGAKKFGVADPGAIIDAYKRNLAKWKKLTANVGTDTNKLADLIWEHIYSKIDPGSL